MDLTLGDLKYETAMAYMDDINNSSSTIEEHIQKIRKIFDRFREVGVKFNPCKCNIGYTEINVLGFLISPDGIKPNKEVVNGISKMLPTQNLKQLQRFLGAVGFFRRFIPAFSQET